MLIIRRSVNYAKPLLKLKFGAQRDAATEGSPERQCWLGPPRRVPLEAAI
jgi:hypothetical protein